MAYTKNKNPNSRFSRMQKVHYASTKYMDLSTPKARKSSSKHIKKRPVKPSNKTLKKRSSSRSSAYKSRHTNARYATSYHNLSHRIRPKSFPEIFHKIARKSVLTIIVIVMLAMIGFTFFNLIATPEFLVKKEIETIAADYYETYFYPNAIKNNSASIDGASSDTKEQLLTNIFSEYHELGFSRITLNQLLLFDNLRHYESAASLAKYCDLERTTIKIHPDPPYTSRDYHIDYHYSCNF